MPVFIFVDKNVYSDYQTFTENKKLLEKESAFRFAHVDSLNIFRFLDFVIKKPIKTFEKYEEIEDYLRIQFSGLFYLYLEQLQRKKEDERIIDTISELNNVTQRMNEMIKEVGKKVIDENEYKKVTEKQNSLLLEFFVQTLGDNMRIESNNKEDLSKDECEKLAIKLYEYLNNSELKQKYDKSDFKEFTILSTVLSRKLGEEFLTINPLVKLKDINGYQTNVRFNTNIKPIIKNDKTMKFERQLMEHLTRLMDSKTSTFPF
jgi:hypothetical protein